MSEELQRLSIKVEASAFMRALGRLTPSNESPAPHTPHADDVSADAVGGVENVYSAGRPLTGGDGLTVVPTQDEAG